MNTHNLSYIIRMAYSVKVSHIKGEHDTRDCLKGNSSLVLAYPAATPEQRSRIYLELCKQLGGKGALQALRGVMGQAELV